jgi:hypothetical protein
LCVSCPVLSVEFATSMHMYLLSLMLIGQGLLENNLIIGASSEKPCCSAISCLGEVLCTPGYILHGSENVVNGNLEIRPRSKNGYRTHTNPRNLKLLFAMSQINSLSEFSDPTFFAAGSYPEACAEHFSAAMNATRFSANLSPPHVATVRPSLQFPRCSAHAG